MCITSKIVNNIDDKDTSTLFHFINSTNYVSNIAKYSLNYIISNYFKEGFKNDEERDFLSFLVLALFLKMEDGDVCIKLDEKSFESILLKFSLDDEDIDALSDKDNVLLFNKITNILAKFPQFLEFIYSLKNKEDFLLVDDSFCINKDVHEYMSLKDEENQSTMFLKKERESEDFSFNAYKGCPFVLHNERIYLRRYFLYERNIAQFLANSLSSHFIVKDEYIDNIKEFVNNLFDEDKDSINSQKLGVILSLKNRFSVISGGPGTGKTTTVTKLLLLQIYSKSAHVAKDNLKEALSKDSSLKQKIILCAPTGKAAGRMAESIINTINNDTKIKEVIEKMGSKFVEDQIPKVATTIHSLLGVIPHSSKAKFNKDNKLDCDILILDEASMVDISMFSKLIDALSYKTKLILLGDKDQLSSVESGSILGDICSSLGSISNATLEYLSNVSGYRKDLLQDLAISKKALSDNVVLLLKSHRFKEGSIIHKFATFVNNGKFNENDDIYKLIKGDTKDKFKERTYISNKDHEIVSFKKSQKGKNLDNSFISFMKKDNTVEKKEVYSYLDSFCNDIVKVEKDLLNVRDNLSAKYDFTTFVNEQIPLFFENDSVNYKYRAFLNALAYIDFTIKDESEVHKLFELMDTFRIVCSHHNGIFGTSRLSQKIEQLIKDQYGIKEKNSEFFPGQMIMITRNDKALGVNNGDVGFIAREVINDSYDNRGREKTRLVAFFRGDGNKLIKIATPYLSHYESGFVLTVHKSQGSEYDHVVCCFNFNKSILLTKELVYTAITRAKRKITLIYNDESLNDAILKTTQRESGLSEYIKEIFNELK